MGSGWQYRVQSTLGTVTITTLAVLLANHAVFQASITTYVPMVNNLDPAILEGQRLRRAMLVTVCVVVACCIPLYKPRPRRILDVIFLAEKRVLISVLVLATIGYLKWSHRLPRSTLILIAAMLFVMLPAWFVLIRRQPSAGDGRAIVIGDDVREIQDVLAITDRPVLGYVAPSSPYDVDEPEERTVPAVADGSGVAVNPSLDDVENLGGLSRLEDVLVEYDVNTAILAFARPDRAEFFGALDACYDHGVSAMVHPEHADSVLTTAATGPGELVEIDLEPWDWQDYVFKRAFDVTFAAAGLLAFAPFMLVIAAAIKLDSRGPVLYSQRRTAEFGETFEIYKFRSMVCGAEAGTGATLSEEDAGNPDPRVTRVGKILRRTHLDEIPQLWSILNGDMSVVGPRPERPELDEDIQTGVVDWQKRWFIKPGLTGLAQINDATGYEPERKLRYDIEYVRRQSFWFDVKIVVRQVWKVGEDIVETVRSEE